MKLGLDLICQWYSLLLLYECDEYRDTQSSIQACLMHVSGLECRSLLG